MILNRIRRVTRDGRWIPEIDGLRFVAIIGVFLFHLAGELHMRSGHVLSIEPRYNLLFSLIGNGDRGVRLFFVISGMILALPFARQYLLQAREVSLRKYYMRRVTRLEPPYILSIILLTVMMAVYSHGLPAGYFGHFVASLFYQHNLVYGQMSLVNPVTWSLEVEIQFYVLAPLVMMLFRIPGKWTRRLLLGLAVLLIGIIQHEATYGPRVTGSVLYYGQYFLAGLIVADIFVLDLERMPSSWLWDLVGLGSLVYMFAADHNSPIPHIVLPFSIIALCLAAMRSLVLRRFFANPGIAVIGGMCYSIYLLHFGMIAAFFKLTRWFIFPQADFLANYLIQLVVTGLPVLAVCTLFYLAVERPCMDPDWPSKLWHWMTGRSEEEVEVLDSAGVSE